MSSPGSAGLCPARTRNGHPPGNACKMPRSSEMLGYFRAAIRANKSAKKDPLEVGRSSSGRARRDRGESAVSTVDRRGKTARGRANHLHPEPCSLGDRGAWSGCSFGAGSCPAYGWLNGTTNCTSRAKCRKENRDGLQANRRQGLTAKFWACTVPDTNQTDLSEGPTQGGKVRQLALVGGPVYNHLTSLTRRMPHGNRTSRDRSL
jgi:hypothetical protein